MKEATCDNCNVTLDRHYNVKDIVLCPLHAAAPDLLAALEAICLPPDGHTAKRLAAANVAIAKAKGEPNV